MQTKPQAALTTLFALLLGYGLMQMGNTFQGTLLSIPRWYRELFARSDRRGRVRLLGRYPDWITALRKMDSKNWTHSGLLGARSDCVDRAACALACDSSDFLGCRARADRVLLCRTVHGR